MAKRSAWPKEAHTAGNAGVMVVGRSSQFGSVPAVLLGGRLYTGKKVYAYTDFGGGVERKKGESPQLGALREFAEELFGQTEKEARATADKLQHATTETLVGGRPFVYKGYVMFIVPAETILETLRLPAVVEDASAIDQLLALAKRSSELTSVALLSIEELLAGALNDGVVRPLSVRQLDDEARDADNIHLRGVMVGQSGSLMTIRDTLEAFADEPPVVPVGMQGGHGECHIEEKDTQAVSPPSMSSSSTARPDDSDARKRRWKSSSKPRSSSSKRIAYVFDMETGDPDDVLTLLFLASHPTVDLRAVTITPGTAEQVALVRWLLCQLGLTHVRLGAQGWPAKSKQPMNLSASFYQNFGRLHEGEPICEQAAQVLLECCDESVTLVTGAPLHNLGDALNMEGFRLGRWVAQGGFAGEGVVPKDLQMSKFKGLEVCPTWNFGGNIQAAQSALASSAIGRKICVSKNVCHSVVYDDGWHEALGVASAAETRASPTSRRAQAFGMMHRAMDEYLRHKPGGKKLHDPLALAVALDETVCGLAEVTLFCQKGKWGSRLCPGSDVLISVTYDAEKFRMTLL